MYLYIEILAVAEEFWLEDEGNEANDVILRHDAHNSTCVVLYVV